MTSLPGEEQFLALGWGAMMMALRLFSAKAIFDIGVTMGLVIGVTPATTPMGLAISMRPVRSSMPRMPMDFLPLRSHQTPFDLLRFLATLSS